MTISNVLAGDMPWHIEIGDCLDVLRQLPDGVVQTVVTSPPYFGLRDYGVDGQIGLEESPDAFVEALVDVFREVRRVLRDDGTIWVNMGDSYSGSGVNDGTKNPGISRAAERSGPAQRPGKTKRWSCPLKPKDLMGMPWRLALALQADGWWLRSDIIWAKPNPMPESVQDRPTKAHEYVFLLTKSESYFYDAEAVKEPVTGTAHSRGSGVNPKAAAATNDQEHEGRTRPRQNASFSAAVRDLVTSRNKRTVWEVATESFDGAHFATYPTKLVEPCIAAGTSSVGACPGCGEPWQRITETERHDGSAPGKRDGRSRRHQDASMRREHGEARQFATVETVGWEPGCGCDAGEPVPCIVLDIFNGAGTTGLVANRLGRRYIGIELNPEYAQMARDRIRNDTPGEDRDLPNGKVQLGLFGEAS